MKRKERSVFAQTLGLNFVIVVIIIVCLLVVSIGMRQSFQHKEEAICFEMLDDGMKRLSSQLRNALDNVLMFRDSIQKVSYKGLRRYDAVNLLNAKSSLSSIVNSNELIYDIAFVYEDRDMVITSRSIYYSIDSFLYIYTIDGMDLSVFNNYLSENQTLATVRFLPCSSVSHLDGSQADIAFCYAIPLDTERFTTRKGVAYVFIRLDDLLDIFITERIRPYASFYLYAHRSTNDGRTAPLLSIQNAPENSPYFESTLINSMGTLRSEIRISKRYLDIQMRDTNRFLLLILIVSILSGIGTALWAAHRQSLPMKQAIRRLRDSGMLSSRRKNEYTALMNSVDDLLQEKETISRQLSGYQASLRQNLLDRLFSNNLLSYDLEEAIRMELDNCPDRALIYCGRIFIPSADSNQSMEMTLVMVLEYLKKNLPASAVVHSTDTFTFGLICPCEDDVDAAEAPLKKLLADIPQKFSARVVLTLGGLCDKLHQIGPCFERAQAAYIDEEKYPLADQLIIHPVEPNDQEQGLRLRMLQEIYQFIAAGDAENAIASMKRFYKSPADAMLINLKERYYALHAYILMIAREVAADHPLPEISSFRSAKTLDAQICSLTEAIRQVCEYVCERQTIVQGDQCTVYTDYLKAHFSDPELCASSLATEFKVSEKYLFGLFKKTTGYSPTSFLHHIRMEEAVRLLTECDDTIQDISLRVGFANFGTFFKAFKREYGVAPGKYREMHQTPDKPV